MNAAMLALFTSEAHKHLATLQTALPTDGSAPADISTAIAALQSMRASARLAGGNELSPLCDLINALCEALKNTVENSTASGTFTVPSAAQKEVCTELVRAVDVMQSEGTEGLATRITSWPTLCATLNTTSPVPSTGAAPSPAAAEKKTGSRTASPLPCDTNAPSVQNEDACALPKQTTATTAEKKKAQLPTQLPIDPIMLEMFNTEAEERLAALNEEILRLEEDPTDAARLEALMRAAHSLKGAARIIGLQPVVSLAHALEDFFVAAQKGERKIEQTQTDILLAAVDGLSRLCKRTESDPQPYLQRLAVLTDHPSAPTTATSVENTKSATEPKGDTLYAPVASATQTTTSSTDVPEQIVRVASASITRIMGLAGETVVQSQSLAPLAARLQQIRRSLDQQTTLLEKLQEHIPQQGEPLLQRLRATMLRSHELLQQGCADFDGLTRRAGDLSERLYREVLTSRMRPFREGVQGFDRMVRDLARQLDKKVKFEILGQDTRVDRDVLSRLEAPLTHLLRNSLDHGLQSAEERTAAGKNPENRLTLQALHWAGFLTVRISDDGRGIDVEHVRTKILERGLHDPASLPDLTEEEVIEFLFLPGFSTASNVTELSGRGVGLDVVREMLRTLGGQVQVENRPGQGVTFQLRLPVTRSVARVLLVQIAGETFALPLSRIDRLLRITPPDIHRLEGQTYLRDNGDNIGLVDAAMLLGLGSCGIGNDKKMPVVVVRTGTELRGLRVDSFMGERELVIKPLDPRLGKVRDITALLVLEDGEIVLMLDVDDLSGTIRTLNTSPEYVAAEEEVKPQSRRRRVLVVEDSLTVREMERRLLEDAGYEVVTAIDGVDGWLNARASRFDLLVSDIDMPRMTGLELVRTLRADPQFSALPIVLVSYKDRSEDKTAGQEAGADRYLTKGGFQSGEFLATVEDLLRNGRTAGR